MQERLTAGKTSLTLLVTTDAQAAGGCLSDVPDLIVVCTDAPELMVEAHFKQWGIPCTVTQGQYTVLNLQLM